MSDPHVIVFVRHPEKGKVKSRIASEAGEDAALRIYKKLYDRTIHLAEAITCRSTVHTTFLKEGSGFVQQKGRDLGERMCHAFREIFEQGNSPVIIIGSDCPELGPEIIKEAIELLSEADLVIGPSEDGGYYLLGMNILHSSLFSDIDWGTDKVFRQSIQKAESAGLTYRTLKVLYDVDTVEDARRAGLLIDN